jgi:peptidoglycan hydrolase CwlO-like protein
MSQNKKHKSEDVHDSTDSQNRQAVTRAATEKGDKYDETQKEIKELQAKLNQKRADAAALKKTIGTVAAEVVAQDPIGNMRKRALST